MSILDQKRIKLVGATFVEIVLGKEISSIMKKIERNLFVQREKER
jgi:hypothetical protein